MDSIKIEDQGPNQCHVLVGKRRVAYVCYGENAPINFLPKHIAGIGLTDQEKIKVATHVREEMAKRTKQRDEQQQTLKKLVSGNVDDGADKRKNPAVAKQPQDKNGASS
jgi:hypothetical protein